MKNNLKNLLKGIKNSEDVNIDPEFKNNAKIRLLNSISNQGSTVQKSFFSRNIKPMGYVFAALGTVFVLGGGTVFASQASLPNQPLYPIKIASEKFALAVAPSSQIKKQMQEEINKRREEETKIGKKGENKNHSKGKSNQKTNIPPKKEGASDQEKPVQNQIDKLKEERPPDQIQNTLEDKVKGILKEEKKPENNDNESKNDDPIPEILILPLVL